MLGQAIRSFNKAIELTPEPALKEEYEQKINEARKLRSEMKKEVKSSNKEKPIENQAENSETNSFATNPMTQTIWSDRSVQPQPPAATNEYAQFYCE